MCIYDKDADALAECSLFIDRYIPTCASLYHLKDIQNIVKVVLQE